MVVSYTTCMSNFVTFKVQMVFYFDCSKLVKFNRNLLSCLPICGVAEGSLVSPPCQRGGPAVPLHVARQSGPAAPRGPARVNGLDLQIKFQ
jgi:hypothetical protein